MIELGSPLAGWVTPLEDVPDPVFADRMLGDGIAVDPVEGRVVAPAAGVVSSIHAAGHAVTLTLDSGPELLIHIGLDTVALGGEGFTTRVKNGERVAAGQALIDFDLELLARRARSLVTPVIVTNGEAFRIESCGSPRAVRAGDRILKLEPVATSVEAVGTGQATASRTVRLLLAHGLHARPAARLAKLAGDFDAQVQIVAADGRVALARSPVTMLGLGLAHAAEITVQGSGRQADQAVTAIAELLDSGMGELQPLTAGRTMQPARPTDAPSELRGISAVPGMAIGPAWIMEQGDIAVHEEGRGVEEEREALAAARARLEHALGKESESDHGGAIAAAHLAMVADPALGEAADRLIEHGKSAAFAWRQAVDQFAAPLRASKDPRFAERLDDLVDLERRVLTELDNEIQPAARPPSGAIVIAHTLYPSQLTMLSDTRIAGIATAAGGATSHAAIIAAGLGIPMLVGLGDGVLAIEDGRDLILQGDTLSVASSPTDLERAREELGRRRARRAAAVERSHELAMTADGTRIEVFANLGSVGEAAIAVEQGAEGCGLLRTEFLFLDRDAPPGEAEQREAYQQVANALGERPLIVRTLDIGADKPAPWLPVDPEDNPALGLRGIRLQLAQPELLETQLRALLGVRSRAPLKIMLPMITTVTEVREVRDVLNRLAAGMGATAPELGIMVETPAAALLSSALAHEAAFFSIGTNDLSQYALACDRTNRAVGTNLDGLHPSVLRLIYETVRGAAAHGRTTGVCGGLAATPEAVPILIGLGVTELSVPASAVAEIKAIVRALHLEQCRDLAKQALAAPEAATVRELATTFLEQVA